MIFYYLFNILFVNPCIEWGIHKIFHHYNIKYHKDHHIQVHHNQTETEYYFLFIIPAFYYCNYITLSIGAANYLATHTALHFYPKWVDSELLEHHTVHHKQPNYNFAVTSIMPDILFSTRYYKKI